MSIIPSKIIENKIFLIRGQKVMLDRDLAKLYEVPTKSLNLAVKRNTNRFPGDFMFQLTKEEYKALRFQFETSKPTKGGRRYLPFAFTEQGVAMLSTVLKSERAIMVNIQIIRTFTKLKEMLLSHEELRKKVEIMERKYDQNFQVIFKAIRELIEPTNKTIKKIGFK